MKYLLEETWNCGLQFLENMRREEQRLTALALELCNLEAHSGSGNKNGFCSCFQSRCCLVAQQNTRAVMSRLENFKITL